MSRGEDNMFERWARRKRAVAEAESEAEAAEPAAPEPDETLPEADLLEKLGLPDPDTLQEGDDFAAFLKNGVPEFLKKRALRRLWLSNPALANLDGLLEYGEDFTDAAMVPEVVATVYTVGKGMLRDIAEPEPEPETVPETAREDVIAENSDPEEDDADDLPGETVNLVPEPIDDEEEIPTHRPRRMSFVRD